MTEEARPSISVTLDRIEGDIAVLLCGDTEVFEWRLPRAWLPSGVKEGERLTCTLAPDPQTTVATTARNLALRHKLARSDDRAGHNDIP